MPTVSDVLQQHQQWLRDEFLQASRQAGPNYAMRSLDELREGFYSTIDAFVQTAVEDDLNLMRQRWLTIAQLRAAQGIPVEEMQALAGFLRASVYRLLDDVYATDPISELAAIKVVERIFHVSRASIAAGYELYAETVRRQLENTMLQGSAPTITVYPGILVMPLVGAINRRRAEVILGMALQSIAQVQAQVIIFDITAVPVVDTAVADTLLQTTRAVRLLGADVVLTGIAPNIAQTIVQLGLDLSSIVTRADLASGLAYALGRRGLAIGPVAQP